MDSRTLRNPLRAALLAAALAALALVATGPGAGAQAGDKILDGRPDPYRSTGWVTAVMFNDAIDDRDRYQRQFCGGSLVAPDWVLTAAHCVLDDDGDPRPPNHLEAMVGEKDLLGSGGEVRDVAQVAIHPRFDSETARYDAALLRLVAPVSEKRVSVIRTDQKRLYPAGTRAYIAGWGDMEPADVEDVDFPEDLHSAFVPIRSKRTCKRAWPNGQIHIPSMICAGYVDGSPDTCIGDSGGPLAIRVRGKWRVVGITSFGRCGVRWQHGVYTRVGAPPVIEWMRETTGVPFQ